MPEEKTLSQKLAEKYASQKQGNNPTTGRKEEDSPYMTDDEFADFMSGIDGARTMQTDDLNAFQNFGRSYETAGRVRGAGAMKFAAEGIKEVTGQIDDEKFVDNFPFDAEFETVRNKQRIDELNEEQLSLYRQEPKFRKQITEEIAKEGGYDNYDFDKQIQAERDRVAQKTKDYFTNPNLYDQRIERLKLEAWDAASVVNQPGVPKELRERSLEKEKTLTAELQQLRHRKKLIEQYGDLETAYNDLSAKLRDKSSFADKMIKEAQEIRANAPYYDPNTVSGFLGSVAFDAVPLTVMLVASPVTGGTTGAMGVAYLASMGASSAGAAMFEYEDYQIAQGREIDRDVMWGVGIANMMFEILAESIRLPRLLPANLFVKGAMGEVVQQGVKKETANMWLDVASRLGNKNYRAILKEMMKQGNEEGMEEVFTEISQTLVNNMYKDEVDKAGFIETMQAAAQSYLGGFLVGSYLGGVKAPVETYMQNKTRKENGGVIIGSVKGFQEGIEVLGKQNGNVLIIKADGSQAVVPEGDIEYSEFVPMRDWNKFKDSFQRSEIEAKQVHEELQQGYNAKRAANIYDNLKHNEQDYMITIALDEEGQDLWTVKQGDLTIDEEGNATAKDKKQEIIVQSLLTGETKMIAAGDIWSASAATKEQFIEQYTGAKQQEKVHSGQKPIVPLDPASEKIASKLEVGMQAETEAGTYEISDIREYQEGFVVVNRLSESGDIESIKMPVEEALELFKPAILQEEGGTKPEQPAQAEGTPAVTPAGTPAANPVSTPATEQQKPIELPRNKDNEIDFDNIQEPEIYAAGLIEEFGEDDAADVIAGKIQEAEDKLKAAGKQKDVIKRKRAEKKAQAEIERFKAVQGIVNPQTNEQDQQNPQAEAQPQQDEAAPDQGIIAQKLKTYQDAMNEGVAHEDFMTALQQEIKQAVDNNERSSLVLSLKEVEKHIKEATSRQESIQNKVEGIQTEREFANGVKTPGKLVLIEADELQPSHKAMRRNPKHGIAQAQPKERNDKASDAESTKIANNPDWNKLANQTLDVYHGAPTVNSRGEVIQGNNRSEALLKYWEFNPQDNKGYKQYLIDNAEALGLNPEQIANMQRPVLVNMIDVADEDAIKFGQYTAQDLETGGIRRITPKETIRKLNRSDVNRLVEILTQNADGENTIREAIRENGVEALKYLRQKEVISDTQLQSAFKDNTIRKEAVDDLQELLKYNLFLGAEANFDQYFEKLPYRVQNALIKTAHIKADNPQNSIKNYLQEAIKAYRDYKASNADSGAMTLQQWAESIDMFTNLRPADLYSELAMRFAEMFDAAKTEKEIAQSIKQYYKIVNGDMNNMFPTSPISMQDALKEIFNFTPKSKEDVKGNVQPENDPANEQRGAEADQAPGEGRGTGKPGAVNPDGAEKPQGDNRGRDESNPPEAEVNQEEKPHVKAEEKEHPLFKLDDVSYERAMNAHRGTSFSPEKRAKSVQKGYVEDMIAFEQEMNKIAKSDDQKALIPELINQYKEGYLKKLNSWLDAKSRTLSPMITGPANFPVSRNEKANNSERKRGEEFTDYVNKFTEGAKKRIQQSATAEQIEDEGWQKVSENIKSSAKTVVDIDTGKEKGYSRQLFTASITGLVNRLFKNGQHAHVIKALDLIDEINKANKKPVISSKSKIWELREQAEQAIQRQKENPQQEAESEVLFENDNVTVLDNKEQERVQIITTEKPSDEIRSRLKKNGFRWSPSNKAWQRKNTREGIRVAENFAKENFPQNDVPLVYEPLTSYDEYQKDETEKAYGSEEKQNEAVQKVSDNIGKPGTLLVGRETGSPLLKNIKKRTVIDGFKESGYVDVIGQKIETPQDIADLFAIHRSPYIEKSHVVFVREGKIVGTTATTINKQGQTIFHEMSEVDMMYRQFGADGMYFLHNHPSGNPTASTQDVYATFGMKEQFDKHGVNLLGHVIIDTDKFSFIDTVNKPINGDFKQVAVLQRYITDQIEQIEYKNAVPKLFSERENIAGAGVQRRLFEISKALIGENGYPGAIIYLDNGLNISAYDVIPEGADEAAIANIIKDGIDNNLGTHAALVHDGSKAYKWSKALPYGVIDVINTKENDSEYFNTEKEFIYQDIKNKQRTLWEPSAAEALQSEIDRLESAINNIRKERDAKLREFNSRNGLFGDAGASPMQGLFDVEKDVSQDNLNRIVAPYNQQIKTAKEKLAGLRKQLESAGNYNGQMSLFEPKAGYEANNNIPETVEINGKERPTRNSNGKLIANDMEGVRAFWEKTDDLSNKIVESGNEFRKWLDLVREIESENVRIKFDDSGYFTSEGAEFEDYPYDGNDSEHFRFAKIKQENEYDKFNEALEKLANHLSLKLNNPYGDSWYLKSEDGSKTISVRDHPIANSTMRHHESIYPIDYSKGISSKELNNAIEYLFDGTNPDIRASFIDRITGFYSPTEKALQQIKQDKGTPEQMKPATTEEVADTVGQLLKTGLAKEVRMVTPEEIGGILEGNEQLATDRAGNEIGDGSWNIEETVFNFEQFPQISASVSKSATTESTYVTYTNSENGKRITVRFSNHENNAVRFGDQLDGNFATGNQILFHLGLKTREFIPDKYLSIWTTQVAKKNLDQYEQADKTIQELYAMGANADISEYKGKLAKGSNYLILGDSVKEQTKTKRNIFGQEVKIGTFNYKDVKFFRTPTGTVYGFVKNGTVYINSNTPNLNTPIHEFAHLWIDYIEVNHKALFEKGSELIKETIYWERVNADPNYSHLSENARIKEAMAMAIGDKGEKTVKNLGLFARLKSWIYDVWKAIGAQFGIHNLRPEQIEKLTFKQFTDIAVSELLSGENLVQDKLNAPLNRLTDTEYIAYESYGKEEALPITEALNKYDIPITGKVWQQSAETVTPVRTLYNNKNIAYYLYRAAPTYLRELKNSRHLLDLDYKDGVPQINKQKAGKFRDIFNSTIIPYVEMLQRTKYLSTEAAQNIINDIISEAAYAKDYYERYAQGEDVWRTQTSPAFQMELAEMARIKAQAQEDGTFMKAPNGKPTNLNERQWLQVRTKAFKEWFGDWENDPKNASKVVDANGEPMVVYHGTDTEFNEFISTRRGVWLTPDEKRASGYARIRKGGEEGIVMPLYAKIENPSLSEYNDDYSMYYTAGFDGWMSKKNNGEFYTIVVENPTQIKSATGNRGTFDGTNPDIRASFIDKDGKSIPMFQIIGPRGARRLDMANRYQGEVITNNLGVARQMEEAGKEPATIRQATGWERGADGMWRYEVDDYMQAVADVFALEDKRDGTIIQSANVFASKELNNAYPQLKDVSVRVDISNKNGNTGRFNRIMVNDKIKSSEITVKATDVANAQSILIHEIQHAIQEIEGFARGGNMDSVSQRWFKDNKKKALDDLIKKLESLLPSISEKWIDEIHDPITEQIEKIKDQKRNLSNADFSYMAYTQLAGEVEARNAQTRMNFTPEQRRNTTLLETEDVAREDQIFLNRVLSGQPEAMLSSPEAKRKVIEDLNKASGSKIVKTVIVNSPEELPANVVKGFAPENVPYIRGLLHGTTTYYVLNNLHNAYDATTVWMHEHGVHYGLLRLIPNDEMRMEFLNRVFDQIGLEEIMKVLPQDVYNGLPKHLIAEEYIANLADKKLSGRDLTPQQKSIWQQFIDWINKTIGKILDDPNFKITEKDVLDIARAAIQFNLQENELDEIRNNNYETRMRAFAGRMSDALTNTQITTVGKDGQTETGNTTQSKFSVRIKRVPDEPGDEPITIRVKAPPIARNIFKGTRKDFNPTHESFNLNSENVNPKLVVKETFVDKHARLEQLIRIIKEREGNVPSWANPHMMSSRVSSINQHEIDYEFDKKLFTPLMKVIKKIMDASGLDLDSVQKYMRAKHAPERNREHRRKNSNKIHKKNIDSKYDKKLKAISEKIKEAEKNDADNLNELIEKREAIIAEYNKSLSEIDNLPIHSSLTESVYAGSLGDKLLTDEYAKEVSDRYEALMTPELIKEFWDASNAVNGYTLKKYAESGFMSYETYKKVSNMYQYYVPLRGWAGETPESIYEYQTEEYSSGLQSPLKYAKGRESESDDPLPYMKAMGHTAIMMGNKNVFKKMARNMITLNKDMKDLFTMRQVWMVDTGRVDEDGEPIYREAIWEGDNVYYIEDYLNDYDENKGTFKRSLAGRAEELKAAGRLMKNVSMDHYKYNVDHKAKQHEVPVYENGRKYIMVFSDPQIALSINTLNDYRVNSNSKVVTKMMETAPAATRYMSMMLTSKNLAFLPINHIKDVFYATQAHSFKEHGDVKLFLSNYKKAAKAIHWFERGIEIDPKKDPEGAELQDLFLRFLKNGGRTGYGYLNKIEEHKRKLLREIKREAGTNSRWDKLIHNKAFRYANSAIDYLAAESEDISRFATFMVSKSKGRTDAEAGLDAKNITVNFNQKGKVAPLMGALWAFSNASIQGGNNLYKLGRENPKAFLKATSMWMALSFAMAEMMRLLLPDEEEEKYAKINRYIRDNYMVFPSPAWFIEGSDTKKDKYISIPLPHGFKAFWSIGQITSDLVHQEINVTEALGRLLDNITQIGSPIDVTGFIDEDGEPTIRPAVPTWAVPAFDIAVNEDFSGRKVFKEMFTPTLEDNTPESQKGLKNTNKFLVEFTSILNAAVSGHKDVPARYIYDKETGTIKDNGYPIIAWAADINPAKLEHLLEGYTGGAGQFVNQSVKTLYNGIMIAAQQENAEIDTRDLPVINRLYRQYYEMTDLSAYYDLKRKIGDRKYFNRKLGGINDPNLKKDESFVKHVEKRVKSIDKRIENTLDHKERQKLMDERSQYIIEQMKQYNANNE